MGFEAAPPTQPSPEELNERLMAQHGNTRVEHNGVSMDFKDLVRLRAALCPVPPEAAADLEYSVNLLHTNKVELDEPYQLLIKREATDSHKPTAVKAVESAKVTKPEATTKEPTAPIQAARQMQSISEAVTQPIVPVETLSKVAVSLPIIHKEVFKQVIQYEAAEVRVVLPEAKPVLAETPITRVPEASEVSFFSEIEPIEPTVIVESIDEAVITETVDYVPIEAETAELVDQPLAIKVADTFVSEATEVAVEIAAQPLEQFDALPTVEPLGLPKRLESIEQPEQIELQAEKTPAVAVAEYMIQVLPAEAANVYERILELELEAAAEIVAQVEMISIVSDRLHELVLQGNDAGEEAQQITAFLKREYEVLLRSVGVEPTDEVINNFIAYVLSQNYQTQAGLETRDLAQQDDGMREKKLFDEQTVFAKAQQASKMFALKLGSRLGKLAVNSSAY